MITRWLHASGRTGGPDERPEAVREGRMVAGKQRIVLSIDPVFLDEVLQRIEGLLIEPLGSARAEEEAGPAARRRALAQSILDAVGELRSELACSAKGSLCDKTPGMKVYHLAATAMRSISETVRTTVAGSDARRRGVDRIDSTLKAGLHRASAQAVRSAASERLAERVHAACCRMHDEWSRVAAIAATTPSPADPDWVARLRALRESVRPLRLLAGPPTDGCDAAPRKPASITKAQVDRLAREAVRRAHRGYIDDDVFVAAVASGLSYRKAAQQLSTRYNRSVTKRQVEGAVGRCGGLEGIRSRGRAWARLDDL